MKVAFDTVDEALTFSVGYCIAPMRCSSRRTLGAWFAGIVGRLVEDRTEAPIHMPLALASKPPRTPSVRTTLH